MVKEEAKNLFERFKQAVKDHHEFFGSSIPLIASENVTSMAVRRFYLSDFGCRYAEGKVGKRFYQGCMYIDVVEDVAIKLTKMLFNSEHANVQPISGVTANIAAFFALAKPGDKAFSLSVPCGGHISHHRFSAAGIRGVNVTEYPFDMENLNIDVDETRKLALKEKPKVFVLGASLYLFPHPVEEIAEIAREVDGRVMYDASHVLGLIAGKQFHDPVPHSDLVTASTHKTFPGPQRAVIFGEVGGEDARAIDHSVMPCCVSNHHLHSLAAYAVACMEMLEFGESYARQVIRNAKTLAEELASRGIKVVGEKRGYTESHQVVFEGSREEQEVLERNGIFVNVWPSTSLIRVGVQEVTRLGMKEGEMKHIAELMVRALKGDSVRDEVKELSREFSRVHYSFDSSPARDWTVFEVF